MGAIATIALNDGAATPVSHDFDPVESTPGRAVYVCRDFASTSAGFPSIMLQYRRSNSNRSSDRIKSLMVLPYEEETEVGSGIYRVTDVGRVATDIVLPSRFTALYRSHLEAFNANMVAHAVYRALVEDLDPPY